MCYHELVFWPSVDVAWVNNYLCQCAFFKIWCLYQWNEWLRETIWRMANFSWFAWSFRRFSLDFKPSSPVFWGSSKAWGNWALVVSIRKECLKFLMGLKHLDWMAGTISLVFSFLKGILQFIFLYIYILYILIIYYKHVWWSISQPLRRRIICRKMDRTGDHLEQRA